MRIEIYDSDNNYSETFYKSSAEAFSVMMNFISSHPKEYVKSRFDTHKKRTIITYRNGKKFIEYVLSGGKENG